MWDNVLGHGEVKSFLERYLTRRERPHGLLFCGAAGLGKRLLAREFARSLLCLRGGGEAGCACESCRLLRPREGVFNHPDFIEIDIEEGFTQIRIEQIRELAGKSAFAPVLSPAKVCIVSSADTMREPAANSFLKLLEEPPAGWVLILLSEKPGLLLPTILSRVVRLNFHALPEEAALRALAQTAADLPEERRRTLARCSEGSLGEAQKLLEQDFFAYRQQAWEFLQALPLAMPLNYLEGRPWLKYERQEALLFARCLQLLLRDLLLLRLGLADDFYNDDLREALGCFAIGSAAALKGALAAAEAACGNLAGSVGIRLALESMALKIDDILKE